MKALSTTFLIILFSGCSKPEAERCYKCMKVSSVEVTEYGIIKPDFNSYTYTVCGGEEAKKREEAKSTEKVDKIGTNIITSKTKITCWEKI